MAARKLTATSVASLRPGETRWDGGTGSARGFGVRCQRRDKVFFLKYRVYGKQHIYTIGRLGDRCRHFTDYPCTVENARREAEWARGEVVAGRDPLDSVQQRIIGDSVEAVTGEYIRRHVRARGLRTADDIEAAFANYVTPEWRGRPLPTITRADVVRLLDKIIDAGKPGAARNVKMALSGLFKWAIGRGIGGIEHSPVFAVPNPYHYARRDRILSNSELVVLWSAASEMGYPFGSFIQMAILLGQRRSEIAGMRWADIEDSNSVWTIPAEANKAGRPHAVPLSQSAIDLLETCPKIAAPPAQEGAGLEPARYVFTTSGERPISGFSRYTKRLNTKIAKQLTKLREDGHDVSNLFAAPWTLHDLRRTAGTGMAAAGVQRFIIGRVLNHADASVTGVYDRWQYLEEKRAALGIWANKVKEAIESPLRDAA